MKYKKVKIKVPAFEFEADLFVKNGFTPNLIYTEIDTFNNDIKFVLDKVVSKAIAKKLNELDCKVNPKTFDVGDHSCVFPNAISFYKKD